MITSVLSDGTIRRLIEEGRIAIEPWDPGLVQPASVDLRLGDSFRVFHNHRVTAIDLRDPPRNLTEEVVVEDGDAFAIHPGEFALGRTLETVRIPDDIVARIEGKALALDTPVPTPGGWRTMGDLEVGDEVFDAGGRATRVVAVSDVLRDRECFEVVFSDGAPVVADGSHQWEVRTGSDRRRGLPPRVLTTREIRCTLRDSAAEYNHHVARSAPVEYPEKDLPVDPYALGTWIGDGTGTRARLTAAAEPVPAQVAAAGRAAALTTIGVLGDEHIPTDYLQGSVAQRRALLQGLVDGGGHVDEYGRCEFVTTNPPLAGQYCELAASLGHAPRLTTRTATRAGRACGLASMVRFTPDEPVCRLPRKLARQRLGGTFRESRAIVEVRPVESRPVRCVEIAAPRGVFLVTEAFVPTHNSSLGRLGLIVHATAGFVDPGFTGSLTLEITNLTRVPIKLYAGLPIAQLSFMALDAPAEHPYGSEALGSHYQGQVAATESRYMR